MQSYNIFISYRRLGGEATARIIYDRYTEMGYKVFYDVENLRSGDFNKALYSIIDECSDFLMVLSPGALDRCENENDWVRNELAYALLREKNVVPVMLRNFEFPQKLPEDIDAIRYKNGLEASSEFFDAFIEKLKVFLKSRPSFFKRLRHNMLARKTAPFFAALAILCVILAGGYTAYEHLRPKTFPYTQEQRNITGEFLTDVQKSLYYYNRIVSLERDALEECLGYLSDMGAVTFEKAILAIDRSINEINKVDTSTPIFSDQLSNKLDSTPIDKAELSVFADMNAHYKEEAADSLRFVKFIIRDSVFGKDVKKKLIDLSMERNSLSARYALYGANSVTLNIEREFLADFKKSITALTALPYEGYLWIEDEENLKLQVEIHINKLRDVVTARAMLVGDQSVLFAQELENYRTSLKADGLSDAAIDKIIAAILRLSSETTEMRLNIQELEERLVADKDRISEVEEEARAKFAPDPADDMGTLWGKMLRFITLGMAEDAIDCFNVVCDRFKDDLPGDGAYAPAIKSFIMGFDKTGIDYGAVVLGYEPGKEAHEIYRIGDIIVAVNGARCLNSDSYLEFKVQPGDEITILRFEGGEPVLAVETVVPGQPKVATISLTERKDDESTLPFAGLNPDSLWQVMANKIAAYSFPEATDCVQIYHMMVRGSDPDADLYVPAAISFMKSIGDTGVDHGVLVTGVDDENTQEDKLGVGDIIVAINGEKCANSADYANIDTQGESIITVLRRSPAGNFERKDIPIAVFPMITIRGLN